MRSITDSTRFSDMPANVATPALAVATVVPLSAPVPAESTTVTTSVSAERVLPAASWIVITGCAANATADTVDAVGAVVSAS